MKRYILLIIIILVILIFRNYWVNVNQRHTIIGLSAQVDSLKNVVYFYETIQSKYEKNLREAIKVACDTINNQSKVRDSAIFSHGKQIRWLQWHVERLNKLKTNKP